MSGSLGKKLACGHTCSSQCHAGKSGVQMFIMALDSHLEVPSFWIILIYTQWYIYIYIYFHPFRKGLSKTSPPFQDTLPTCKKQVSARNVQSLVVPGKGSKPLADFRWAETLLLKPRRVHCSHTCQVRISPFRELLGDLLGNSVETQNQYQEICEKNSELHQMKMFCFQKEESNQAC